MSNTLVAGLSLGAALAFSVSTTLKKASASQLSRVSRLHTGSIARFAAATVRHPLWLAGLIVDGVGLSLQVTALHLGALALVQPLMVSGLVFALLLRHRHSWRIPLREVVWAMALTACLIGFLNLSGAISGAQHPAIADRLPALIAAAAGIFAAVTCLAIARRRIPATSRAALIGLAVGTVYAGTAALIKATTDVLTSHGVLSMLVSWQLYAVLVLGATGLFLTQLAFQAAPLTASLPIISTIDPLLSIVIGVLVYDEHVHRGPLSGAVLLLLMLLLATSVIQLGRVPAEAQ